VLSSLYITPAKTAGDVAPTKRSGLDALMAFDSKVVLVALPPSSSPETLLGPVARLVRRMAVLADQDLSRGDAQFGFNQTGRLDRDLPESSTH